MEIIREDGVSLAQGEEKYLSVKALLRFDAYVFHHFTDTIFSRLDAGPLQRVTEASPGTNHRRAFVARCAHCVLFHKSLTIVTLIAPDS